MTKRSNQPRPKTRCGLTIIEVEMAPDFLSVEFACQDQDEDRALSPVRTWKIELHGGSCLLYLRNYEEWVCWNQRFHLAGLSALLPVGYRTGPTQGQTLAFFTRMVIAFVGRNHTPTKRVRRGKRYVTAKQPTARAART